MPSEPGAAAPLVDITRGPIVESRHAGHGAAVNAQGELVAWFGDPDRRTFLRSSGKPIQALPMVRSGAADRFNLSSEEVAVVCSSHWGEPGHVAAVRSILAKLGLDESALRCGTHPPVEPAEARRLLAAGEEPRPVHNNCSGKHAGMLTLARHLDADLETYPDPDHPVQRRVAAAMGELLDCDADRLPRGTDGCGVPVWAAPLSYIARAFARLATAAGAGPTEAALSRVRDAMVANPRMVSGTNGPDTMLIELGRGDLVSKGGAEGLRCVGVRSRGLGIAIRCEDGNPRGLEPTLTALLRELDAIDETTEARLRERQPVTIHNWAGTAIGAVVPRATWTRA